MERTLPTARQTILRFIEKGMSDPTFAPVHLSADLSAVDSKTVRADLVRNGESMWDGRPYNGEMKGDIGSYPLIDLRRVPWDLPEKISSSDVLNGNLRANMKKQLDQLLLATPFQIRPVDDTSGAWRKSFSDPEPLDRRFFFELFREATVPEWILELDKLHMRGSWRVFLPNPSPERDIVDKLLQYEYRAAELARFKASPPTNTVERLENSVDEFGRVIAEQLKQLAT